MQPQLMKPPPTNLQVLPAAEVDAADLAVLHRAVADDLTGRFGPGHWSSSPSEHAILFEIGRPAFSCILVARLNKRLVGALRLHTKRPWAIDSTYFSPAAKPLYLSRMAGSSRLQRKGIGRILLQHAETVARNWPADALRLDAYDAAAGAGPFYTKCGFRKVARVT